MPGHNLHAQMELRDVIRNTNVSSDTLLLDSQDAPAEASRESQFVLDERVPLTRAKWDVSLGRKSRTR